MDFRYKRAVITPCQIDKNLVPDESKQIKVGSLQEKVLFYLAENPDNHKQGIQQGIAHPTDQYG